MMTLPSYVECVHGAAHAFGDGAHASGDGAHDIRYVSRGCCDASAGEAAHSVVALP